MKSSITYTPTTQPGSTQVWDFDPKDPDFDIAYLTERATSWPWDVFVDRIGDGSHIALRALVFAYRRRKEPKLALEAVEVTFREVTFQDADDEGEAAPDAEAEPTAEEGDANPEA